jgi:putative transposase
MPSKHIVKRYAEDSYYHIYNRGVNRANVFNKPEDYWYFLSLFKRHLSNESSFDKYGREVAHLTSDVELLAFCLMPNHFHLLVYNINQRGITNLMQRILTAYSMYFNKKYKRVGSLFQSTYKASLIDKDNYLIHISRYIHLNPQDIDVSYKNYDYSSYEYYTKKLNAEWLHPDKILDLFNGQDDYIKFVSDYKNARKELKIIEHALANKV